MLNKDTVCREGCILRAGLRPPMTGNVCDIGGTVMGPKPSQLRHGAGGSERENGIVEYLNESLHGA